MFSFKIIKTDYKKIFFKKSSYFLAKMQKMLYNIFVRNGIFLRKFSMRNLHKKKGAIDFASFFCKIMLTFCISHSII